MKLKKSNSGFTLIEIIVVLIIVGVLAAIALPALFSNIAKSKEAEIALIFKNIKDQVLLCKQANPSNVAACIPPSNLAALTAGSKYYQNFNVIVDPDDADGFVISADPK